MPTPPHFWSFSPNTDWPSEAWLYGAPYVALVVVPASSPAAVATASAGFAFAQAERVIALSSGEEKMPASTKDKPVMITRAITNSLTRS